MTKERCGPYACRVRDVASRRFIFCSLIFLLGITLETQIALAGVGRTAGSFNVTPTGAATYTIPIFTPPGPNGIQPAIALTYNSNAGVGYVGRGWSVAGLSSISRCPRTVAQDGWALKVKLNIYDQYCLDGNRLRLQTGTHGVNGSVYATEVADFSHISANTPGGSYTPTSWTVKRKDGLIYTYGGGGNSTIVDQWMLREIRDRAGNKVIYTYAAADYTDLYGTTHPTKIEWTQTSAGSGSYVYSMDFSYGANAPASSISRYVTWSTPVVDKKLLNGITVSVSGTVKRYYKLTYDTSTSSGAKRLTEVKECSNTSETDCLAPTTITYQNGTAGVNFSTPAVLNNSGSVTAVDGSYDFDGNGIQDIAYQVSGTWYVRFGSVSSGYSSAVSTGLTVLQAGKLLGTPADQLLGVSSGTWHVYYWNGSSFSALNTSITTAASATEVIVGDIDADGLDDLVYRSANTGQYYNDPEVYVSTANITVRRNTSSGGSLSFGSPVTSAYLLPYIPNFPDPSWYPGYAPYAIVDPYLTKGGDANGDGRQDFNLSISVYMGMYPSGGTVDMGFPVDFAWDNRIISFNAYFSLEEFLPSEFAGYSPVYSMPIDLNGDNCQDFTTGDYYTGIGVALSSCDGVGASFDPSTYGEFNAAFDWTGDGVDDYFFFDYGLGDFYVRSSGSDLGSPIASGVGSLGCGVARTDGNGDGLHDLVCLSSGNLSVYFHNGTAVSPDLAVQIEDGFDVTHNPSYTSIARSNYAAYSNASYPNRDMTGKRRVVSQVESTDGIGGTYTLTYTYHGAQVNVQGRGFSGFEKVESVDSRTGILHVRRYERAFPATGIQLEESSYQSVSGPLISSRTTTLATQTLDSTAYKQRYFPYVSAVTEDAYEVGGSRNGDWITRTEISNTYGDWGNLTASTRTTTDKDSSSPFFGQSWSQSMSASYSPDTGTNWCLGIAVGTSTSYTTTTGEAGVSRGKIITPDYANCRVSSESIQPYVSDRRVDTSYGYDSFGNVNSVSVTGRNSNGSTMAARTATIGWGATGQFPISETNALSQTTNRTFHATFGLLLTETDPNAIVVADNDYDEFGRLTYAMRADGTSTHVTYSDCAPGCKNGDPGSSATGINKMIITASEHNTSDVQFRASRTYLDQFGRAIVQEDQTISGNYSRIGTQYDLMGRVHRQTAPCEALSCTAYWITNTYDLLGRLTAQSRPMDQGDSTPVTTTYTYAGRSQTATAANSKNSTKIMDVNGWMRRSTDHDGYHQSFGYDAFGSLKEVTDSLSNTLFSADYSYGIRPFQTSATDMNLGATLYWINSLGEIVQVRNANNQTSTFVYDALSRLTSRTEAEGTTTFTYGTSPGSYNIGRLASVSMTGYSESLAYDNKGRPSTQTITTDQAYAIDYAYTNQGMLDTLTYPTSTSGVRFKVTYGYDHGILTSVTDSTPGSTPTVYWTVNTKNSRGQTTRETLGNGVETVRDFDAVTGWLDSIESGLGGGTGLQHHAYLYDVVGNVTQRQENSPLALTEDFYYDNLNRLDYSRRNGVINLDLTYDAMGNITNRTDVNGNATWTYHSTKKHAVESTGSGGTTYSYDANGNMTNRGGSTIVWSSFNYPTYLETATENTTFYYGPNRQYYRQDYSGPSGNETTYYVGGILEKVFDGTTTDWRHYIKAEGQTVAIVSRKASGTNTVNYALEDHQGSGSVLVDSSGTGYTRQSYNAFGLPRDGNDWDGAVLSGDQAAINAISRRGYTSHSMLGEMGLIHMNGRVLDAVTGRFLSPDPFVFQPGLTQGFNRYAYVANNPLSYIDPSGFGRTQICNYQPDFDWYYDFEVVEIGSEWAQYTYTGHSSYRPTGTWTADCYSVEVPDDEPGVGGSGSGSSNTTPRSTTQPESPKKEPQSEKEPLCRASENPFTLELSWTVDIQPPLLPGFGGGFGIGFTSNGQFFFSFTAQAELGEVVNLSTGPQLTWGREKGNFPVREASTEKFIGAQYAVGMGPVASGGWTRSESGNSFGKGVGKLGGGFAGQVAMVAGTNSKIAMNKPICR